MTNYESIINYEPATTLINEWGNLIAIITYKSNNTRQLILMFQFNFMHGFKMYINQHFFLELHMKSYVHNFSQLGSFTNILIMPLTSSSLLHDL